jgi:peptidoglycan/xylan/chitin deacetylase (PgdA/CDA1 family)
MNRIKNFIFSFLASNIHSGWLYKSTPPLVINPFYHTISNKYLPHINILYKTKKTDAFIRDIDYLNKYFIPASANDIFNYYKKNNTLTKRAYHISFDDGLKEIYTHVMPYLHEKGIPATIFINTAFVDNKAMFYRHKIALIIDKITRIELPKYICSEIENILGCSDNDNLITEILNVGYKQSEKLDKIAGLIELDFEDYLQKQQPYLTTVQLLEMQQKGFSIGAHSIDHPPFCELNHKEQMKQIVESVNFVKKNFNEKYALFSFPFTDEKIDNALFESIEPIVDLTFGITGIGTKFKGMHIARIDMERYGKNAKESINKAYIKYKFR